MESLTGADEPKPSSPTRAERAPCPSFFQPAAGTGLFWGLQVPQYFGTYKSKAAFASLSFFSSSGY